MLWNPLLPYMRRKHREIPCIVCHVPADAALSFTALVIITIKTHVLSLPIHPKVRKQDLARMRKILSDSRN